MVGLEEYTAYIIAHYENFGVFEVRVQVDVYKRIVSNLQLILKSELLGGRVVIRRVVFCKKAHIYAGLQRQNFCQLKLNVNI